MGKFLLAGCLLLTCGCAIKHKVKPDPWPTKYDQLRWRGEWDMQRGEDNNCFDGEYGIVYSCQRAPVEI